MTLKEELEILRGEPIQVFTGNPMDIPCVETSDSERLCKHPVVSVSMITYNHEPYIRQAIEGVMMQKTDFEFELVIGEDCSTDSTREICFEYQKRYPDKIRVLWCDHNLYRNPHPAGGNSRRNMAHCRGEFIALCEGDDYWIDPLKLQKQVDVMRNHPNVGFCFCGAIDRYQDTGVEITFDGAGSIPVGQIAGKDYLEMNIFGSGSPLRFGCESFIRTATAMIRVADYLRGVRECEILNWRLRLGDVPIWLSLATVSDVYYLPDQVATYRINNGGACARLGNSLRKDNYLSRVYFWILKSEAFKLREASLLRQSFENVFMRESGAKRNLVYCVRYICKIKKTERVVCFSGFKLPIFVVCYYLRYECPLMKPLSRFYRRLRGHGEYAI